MAQNLELALPIESLQGNCTLSFTSVGNLEAKYTTQSNSIYPILVLLSEKQH